MITSIGTWLGEAWAAVCGWFNSIQFPNALKLFSNATVNRFGADKASAKKQGTRVSEKKLFRVCFWGGAIGGMIGMYLFRHKTLKKKFSVGVPILFLIQLLLDSFILGFLGFWTFF